MARTVAERIAWRRASKSPGESESDRGLNHAFTPPMETVDWGAAWGRNRLHRRPPPACAPARPFRSNDWYTSAKTDHQAGQPETLAAVARQQP